MKKTLLALTAALAASTTVLPAPAHAAPVTCSQDCIYKVVFHPDGTHVGVQTDLPTLAKVTVYGNPARTNVVASASSHNLPNGHVAGHMLRLYDSAGRPVLLKGGQTYYLRVEALDATGVRIETPTMKTWQRRLTISLTRVAVTDDSDTGAGELTLDAQINDLSLRRLFTHKSISAYKEIDNVGTFVTNSAPLDFRLDFTIQDDDCEFSTCYEDPLSIATYQWGEGPNVEWRTASTANLHTDYFLQVHQGSFQTSVDGGDGNLAFYVFGNWKMEFIP